ncbi:MAG: hypothetical protein J6S02_05725, partial [Bacteroidaceae bacterium]|nr:hypothetical protein [Bacteroidaceae bacterium]
EKIFVLFGVHHDLSACKSHSLLVRVNGEHFGGTAAEHISRAATHEDDVAVWPAVAVDFTAKTQFLFMINKGISHISENAQVNEFKAEDERPVPFKHMIYFGDGETDIPCMRLIKQQGGNSIAVYKPKNQKKKQCAEKLVNDKRVNFACPADYSKDSDIYNIVHAIIKQVKADFDFNKLQKDNQKKFTAK